MKKTNLNSKSIKCIKHGSTKKIEIAKNVWSNYGKIFAKYIFIRDFKNNPNISKSIVIENSEILKKLKSI